MIYLILITFALVPAYVIKFKLLGLPSDILMFWVILVWIIFFAWLIIKKQTDVFLTAVKNTSRPLLIFIGLFFLSGIISLFAHGIDRAKLGQFIVLFLQPISLFFICGYIFQQNPNSKNFLLSTCYFLLALAGLYALIQYFTLLGLPQGWWGNANEPKRAVSFFIHPNFYALWSAPLLALLIPDLVESSKFKVESKKYIKAIAWVLGAVGLLLSLSRAGWLGLAAAVIVYLIIAADSKIRKAALGIFIALLIIIFSVPNLRYRIILPFYGEKSAVSRLSLWHTGIKAVKGSPLTGLGLAGFGKNWHSLNTDPGLDTHNFPHNIFLDLWVETGLLGLISFLGICTVIIYKGFRNRTNIITLSLSLFIIAIIFQGLTDNPYFKNDLAMVFWIVLALCSL